MKINNSIMEVYKTNNTYINMVKESKESKDHDNGFCTSSQTLSNVFKVYNNHNNNKTNVVSKKRYEIVHELGCGAFGTVYKATDLQTFGTVALKISDDITTHRREHNFLKRCKGHPQIIQCYDAFTRNTESSIEYCLSIEYADESLRQFLRHRTCHYTTAKSIIRQICLGLSFIHSLGFIHSDLKPDNIVVIHKNSDIFRIKLIDFGCVRKISQIPILYPGDSPDSFVYFTTRWFRSPEVILGHTNYVGSAIDIWAVGCIAFQLITRKYLFCGMNHEDMLSWFELFLGRIPSEVLERNVITYESYFTYHDSDDILYIDPQISKQLRDYYDGELLQNRLMLTNNYVQDEHDLEDIPRYNLKSRTLRSYIFGEYPQHLRNPRCYLSNMITDVSYYQLIMSMLSYDPLLRPEAINIADALH